MGGGRKILEVAPDDFARRLSMRPAQLMWLLGAGASASAGIPTAWDMIWRFKQQLFIAQRKVSPNSVADLANPAVRNQIDAHIAASGQFPVAGAPEEYAALFEATYPIERDRSTFIEAAISGAKPSYGHLALAALLKAGHAHLVWTTNFDHLLADACARTYETTGALTTVALDSPELAGQRISGQHWPIEIKLHGDFRSRRLKNTSDELRHQDAELRRQLADTCQRYGMIIAGYSGRDDSVMDALEQAVVNGTAFPGGLFWLHRSGSDPLPRVMRLMEAATAAGIECGIVGTENFDETMRDVVRLMPDLDMRALDALGTERSRVSAAPTPAGKRGWPIVRMNAIEVASIPGNCRKLTCTIGGFADVRKAIADAGAKLIVTRTRAGVLGFGSDDEFRRAFSPYTITEFDLAPFETRRLRYDSHERGLLRDALVEALVATNEIDAQRHRHADYLAPRDPQDDRWGELRAIVGQLSGTLKRHTDVRWREGVSVRLAWASDRLWLLIDPRLVFEGVDDATKAAAADFARERTVKRYNRELDRLIQFWSARLAGDELRALSIGDGIDAKFSLAKNTAFSRTIKS